MSAPLSAGWLAPPPADLFAARLIAWQRNAGRHDLPWQRTSDPYRVWLSEIMLQQTQVATVLDYYDRFLLRFADVTQLAAASQQDVLAMWSGLGYYSRARNLHRCAQVVVERHAGEFPRSAAELAELPGIGRSTAAAIAAFCFGEHVAILDGNVKRVLTRVLGFDGDLALAAPQRLLWAEATRLLPPLAVRDAMQPSAIAAYTQGLMDLGAGICRLRAPDCPACPLRELCVAANAGVAERYPVKRRKLKRSRRENGWLVLFWRRRIWLVRRPQQGIWAGLWSLCEFDSASVLSTLLAGWPGSSRPLPAFKHMLTHLDWHLQPVLHQLPDELDSAGVDALTAVLPTSDSGRWFERDEIAGVGAPAPLLKLLAGL